MCNISSINNVIGVVPFSGLGVDTSLNMQLKLFLNGPRGTHTQSSRSLTKEKVRDFSKNSTPEEATESDRKILENEYLDQI